ncbi:MAG TPA: hypothetical protein VK776_28145 [Bryobacteraceae bacterium]|nr:hypothetical protein [Bryobacteraceae bacterium]
MRENVMGISMRLAASLCLQSALSFAGSWSGALIDSKCYDSEERNVNPTDTMTYVDRDKNLELRYCAPGARTKYFAVVQQDGLSFKLDSAGNSKAAELVRKTGKRSVYPVAITGEMNKNTIQVDSLSMVK